MTDLSKLHNTLLGLPTAARQVFENANNVNFTLANLDPPLEGITTELPEQFLNNVDVIQEHVDRVLGAFMDGTMEANEDLQRPVRRFYKQMNALMDEYDRSPFDTIEDIVTVNKTLSQLGNALGVTKTVGDPPWTDGEMDQAPKETDGQTYQIPDGFTSYLTVTGTTPAGAFTTNVTRQESEHYRHNQNGITLDVLNNEVVQVLTPDVDNVNIVAQ